MTKGLEDKLDGVHVGDLLCLQRNRNESKDTIVGFVRKYTDKWVVLSHESPRNTNPYVATWNSWHVTNGNRRYLLCNFDAYQIIALPAVEKK